MPFVYPEIAVRSITATHLTDECHPQCRPLAATKQFPKAAPHGEVSSEPQPFPRGVNRRRKLSGLWSKPLRIASPVGSVACAFSEEDLRALGRLERQVHFRLRTRQRLPHGAAKRNFSTACGEVTA
jgi:hypothetical protein